MKVSFRQNSVTVFFRSHIRSFRRTCYNSVSIFNAIPSEYPIAQMQIHVCSRRQLCHHIMNLLGFRASHHRQVRPGIFVNGKSFTISRIKSISKPFKTNLFATKAQHGFQPVTVYKCIFRSQERHWLRRQIDTTGQTSSHKTSHNAFCNISFRFHFDFN